MQNYYIFCYSPKQFVSLGCTNLPNNMKPLIKDHLIFIIIALCMIFFGVLPAFADGEQINGGGTRWVDPVVFFKLQDINNNNLQRSYYKGDIDINKVIKKKGVKIYGMRLKPIAAAGMVPSEARKTSKKSTWTFSYYNVMGVEGIALHEAGFCIYADESVSRTYDYDYNFECTTKADSRTTREHVDAHGVYNIKNLTFVPQDGGIGFSYAFEGKDSYKTTTILTRKGYSTSHVDNQTMKCNKPAGVNNTLGHFIYFNGDSHLLLILSAGATSMTAGSRKGTAKGQYASKPWHRVFFEVEEIQVDAAVAATEEGEELLPGEEPAPELTKEDKEELKSFIEDLTSWLKGEGDPLGLGEHTGAKESAVIGAIGTVASILLGSGLAGFVSGTGAQIASNMTNTIIGGGGADLPPSLPQGPDTPALEPKRPEEEEKPQEPEPNPDDGKLFKPTDYPELCEKYIKEAADGTITYTNPATGEKTEYYPTEDGQWTRCYDPQEPKWTTADLEERLRFEYENQGYVRDVARTAERNSREQREQWDAMNKRDLERGYTDDMKDYKDWKDEQAKIQKKEEYLEKLADKYHTSIDNLKNEIGKQQALAEEESYYQQEIAKQWDSAIEMAEKIDKYSEAAVNIMGECIPGGRAVKNAYTFAKATLVAASEAVAEGKSLGEGLAHVAVGMGQGALGVIQNQAGDLTKNSLKEYAMVVGGEALKAGMKTYSETGDMEKTLRAMANATGKKTAEFYTAKAFSKGMKFLQDSAKQSLNPGITNINDDTGLRFSDETSTKILKWFGGGNTDLSKTTGFKGWNITDANGNFSFTGTSNVTFGGQIDLGKLFEAGGPELLGKGDAYDWAGDLYEGAFNMGEDIGQSMHDFFHDAEDFKNQE